MVVPISDSIFVTYCATCSSVEAALQRVLQFLQLVGGGVDLRHGHVGDAEHDPLAATGARRLPDAVLGASGTRP